MRPNGGSYLGVRSPRKSGTRAASDETSYCRSRRPSSAPLRAVGLAGVEGLEPPTPGFGDRGSDQLSYHPKTVTATAIYISRATVQSGGGRAVRNMRFVVG